MKVDFESQGLLVTVDKKVHIMDKCLLPVNDAHASGNVHRPFLRMHLNDVGSRVDYRSCGLSPGCPKGHRKQERYQQQ